ncbi:MAG: pilus assembly protein PilM [Pseudobdellovibrionaceae bacterium]
MKSVGIDIGTSSIKVVEVVSSNKGVQVTRFAEHPLDINLAFDPDIEILEYLRRLASSYDLMTTRFVFGLRQEQVSVRNRIFPFSDRQKVLKSLPFELEEDLPFSNETAIFDAKIIRTLGPAAEVLACAAPKTRVNAALEKLASSGMDVSLLSAEGVAFANCFEKWDQVPPAHPAVQVDLDGSSTHRDIAITIDIGHTRTLVCAFESNMLIGVRTILWGGKNVADGIVKKYEIPYVEALKEMQTKAFILPSKEGASYDQIVFSDTIAQQVKDLARELKISILEFKAEFNGSVQSVGLTGGASQILNLHAYLTQQLELPVNKQSVLGNFQQLGFEKTARTDSIIGVALGLAIEGLKKPRNPALNFLKGDFAKESTFYKVFWQKWNTTIQIGAAALLVFFLYSMIRDSVTVTLAESAQTLMKEKAKTVAKLPSKNQTESGVKKYVAEQRKRINDMRALSSLAKMNSAMDVMKKINDAIPARQAMTLDVRKLAINESQVVIEGTVGDNKQFQTLESSLASIAIDKVTRTQPEGKSKKPGVPFAFTFKVDRGLQTRTQ